MGSKLSDFDDDDLMADLREEVPIKSGIAKPRTPSKKDNVANQVPMTTNTQSQKPIRHPSWRVYKAIRDCGLNPIDYGLKDTEVEYIFDNEDELTTCLKSILMATKSSQSDEKDEQVEEDPFGIKPCLDVFMSPYDKQLLEGLLLAGKTIDDICESVECDESFVITYQTLFFDTTVFRNNVDKLIYVRKGTMGEDSLSKNEVLTKGCEYLKAKNGVSADKIRIADVLADSFAKAYMKMTKLADEDGLDSQESAQGWANVLVKIAAELNKDKSGTGNITDLVVHLQGSPAPKKGIDDLQ